MNIDAHLLSKLLAVTVTCSSALVACGVNPADSGSEAKLSGATFSVSCEFGWNDCYSEARRRCANGDFVEVDRNAIEPVIADSHATRTKSVRADSMNLTMTIRCK